MPNQRIGYDLIIEEIATGSRVLDLGCGDGALLRELKQKKNIECFGVELSDKDVSQCLENGVFCYQGDIDEGLVDYQDNSFDYVILNQTLQDTKRPELVIREMMRICSFAIISFPNFGHHKNRLQLLLHGTVPKNSLIPYEWYESPNIHNLSITDFRTFCLVNGYPIKTERHFSANAHGRIRVRRLWPNMFAQYGFFILDGRDCSSRQLDYSI